MCFQRWLFSTAFTPIDNWSINKTASISNHLQTCPYFIRAEPRQQPIALLGLCPEVILPQDIRGDDSLAQFYPHVVPNRPGYQTAHGKFAEVMTRLACHMMSDDSDGELADEDEEEVM